MIEHFTCLRCGHLWVPAREDRRCWHCRAFARPKVCPKCRRKKWWLEVGREVPTSEDKLRTYLRHIQTRAWNKRRKALAAESEKE